VKFCRENHILVQARGSAANSAVCYSLGIREIRRIPVVVLTTDDDPATVNAAYDLGANSYLVKPAMLHLFT
jgi:DNA-binding NarL/FixJ family response regulator